MKMKRNLIAVAVTSAVSAAMVAPAMAEVTAYGRAQVEIASYDYEDKDAEDGITMKDESQGQVGLKASEDLGNGWTGLAKFEFKADTTDNATSSAGGSLTARESMVGLKGAGVQVELGNLKQPYKYYGGVTYDPFVATTLEARSNEGMTGKIGDLFNAVVTELDRDITGAAGKGTCKGCGNANDFGHASFIDNAIGVEGGSGPIKARLTYGPNEGDGSWSVAVKFAQDNFEVIAAATDTGDKLGEISGATNDTTLNGLKMKYSSNKIGGQFKAGPHTISAQYEMGNMDFDAVDVDVTTMYIDYNMKMGKNMFDIAYGQTDYDVEDCDVGCTPTFMRVAVRHSMSKETSVFAGYRKTDGDDADDQESVISVGLRKDF